jgi:IS30 family transposase
LINQRTPEINSRRQAGHWEADSMVSKASRTSLHVLPRAPIPPAQDHQDPSQ